jgi:hypothetical protein
VDRLIPDLHEDGDKPRVRRVDVEKLDRFASVLVAEYRSVTVAGLGAAAAYGASLAREELIPLGGAG